MPTFTGVVQKGSKRAAALGYPTINIPLHNDSIEGVYAARVYIKDDSPYIGAAFADQSRKILEVHILDFSNDLYGMEVRIVLHEKIRETAVYRNDTDLKAAIQDDIAKVRKCFKN